MAAANDRAKASESTLPAGAAGMSSEANTSWMLSKLRGAWPAGAGAGLFRNALREAPKSAPSPFSALFSFSTNSLSCESSASCIQKKKRRSSWALNCNI